MLYQLSYEATDVGSRSIGILENTEPNNLNLYLLPCLLEPVSVSLGKMQVLTRGFYNVIQINFSTPNVRFSALLDWCTYNKRTPEHMYHVFLKISLPSPHNYGVK